MPVFPPGSVFSHFASVNFLNTKLHMLKFLIRMISWLFIILHIKSKFLKWNSTIHLLIASPISLYSPLTQKHQAPVQMTFLKILSTRDSFTCLDSSTNAIPSTSNLQCKSFFPGVTPIHPSDLSITSFKRSFTTHLHWSELIPPLCSHNTLYFLYRTQYSICLILCLCHLTLKSYNSRDYSLKLGNRYDDSW